MLFLLLGNIAFAQKKTTIHILNADKADYDDRLGKDVQRLIGNVIMRQDSTYFYSDSAYFNEKTKFFDGFGNVHINVNDSVNIYSKLLKYNGETKFAGFYSWLNSIGAIDKDATGATRPETGWTPGAYQVPAQAN